MTRGRPADQDPLWSQFMDAVKAHVAEPSQPNFDAVFRAWAAWADSFRGADATRNHGTS